LFHVVLYQPEIPPNCGNIIRLCANTGAHLHLIEPLGFDLSDRELKRAGLDYHEHATVERHASLAACLSAMDDVDVFAFSTKGVRRFSDAEFRRGCILLFGPETRGLPDEVLDQLESANVLRIPMTSGSRSLNLSNAVAVAVYEAWRQLGYSLGR
jgi:tRNA (cytidine/uridine-2'-O-)-methyltransferase